MLYFVCVITCRSEVCVAKRYDFGCHGCSPPVNKLQQEPPTCYHNVLRGLRNFLRPSGAYGRFPKVHCVFLGRDPGTLKSDIVSKKTSTMNLFGFETLKLKIRRLKLWKPTVYYTVLYYTIIYYTMTY